MNSYNLYKQYFVLRPAWQPTIGNDTKIYTIFFIKIYVLADFGLFGRPITKNGI